MMIEDKPRIRFGPSGNSDSFYAQGYTATSQAPAWIKEMGLTAFEYSFGHGIRIKDETAGAIAEQAKQYDIQMSVHLPYYVNLTVSEPEKQQKNRDYFMQAVSAGSKMGAIRGVFHPGSAGKGNRLEPLAAACNLLRLIMRDLDAAGYWAFTLCPETMGKFSQLGDLEEVLTICGIDERLIPCIDFGHLHCRGQGALKSKEDFAEILDAIEDRLGMQRARSIHIHFSRIEYTASGEKMHHTFADTQYGPEFPPLAELLAERKYSPVVICESRGTMAEDAIAMQKMYEMAVGRG